jgi:hypothetical protein
MPSPLLSPLSQKKSPRNLKEETSKTTNLTKEDHEEEEEIEVEDTEHFSNKKEPEIDATEISNLAEDLKIMNVSSKKYNMGFQNLYIMYDSILKMAISVYPLMCWSPLCTADSSTLPFTARACILILVLWWCLNSFGRPTTSLLQTKKRKDSTRTHTKRQPSIKSKEIQEDFNPFKMEEVLSGAQHFKLPFKVEHDYYTGDGGQGWVVQVFDNEDSDLYHELDSEVMIFFVLSVNLVSVEKPRKQKHKGTM